MKRLLGKIGVARRLTATFGPAWLVRRAAYSLKKKAGWARIQLPLGRWEDRPLARALRSPELATPAAYAHYRRTAAPPFLFDPAVRPAQAGRLRAWDTDGRSPCALAEELADGRFRLFGLEPQSLGMPPRWHRNFLSGRDLPHDRHWSQIGDFGHGDIKTVWELSRFGFAFTLVRSYWRTGDERYPELFWRLLEDWRQQNPPNQGPNWKCGQEASLRLMAWCFALYGFLDAQATTPERIEALAQMIAFSGTRIEATLSYALGQKNNHGISEGAGLWTIGLLFPEFARASRWRELGRRVLESQAEELIYDDGSFSQHSVNYHRVMVHDLLWAVQLGARNNAPLSAALSRRLAQAGRWLAAIQDRVSGGTPRYGAADGALVLPLSNCAAADYRPVVQSLAYLAEGRRRFDAGPWDEDLFWLFGPEAAETPVEASVSEDLSAAQGGYYTLRSDTGLVFTRCVTSFRHRPSQADLLHVDLWWQGQNIALDPGTYSYNAQGVWDNAFSRTRRHNTVEVDGVDQMDQVGRFLWLPWATGRVNRRAGSAGGAIAYWEGEHHGYRRLPSGARHRRAIVRLGAEHWVVLDAIEGRGPIRGRLHWLLADLPHAYRPTGPSATVVLQTPAGDYQVVTNRLDDGPVEVDLVRGQEGTPEGWRATDYLTLAPAVSLALSGSGTDIVRFATVFGPAGFAVQGQGETLQVAWGEQTAGLTLGHGADLPLATAITLEGRSGDSLELGS